MRALGLGLFVYRVYALMVVAEMLRALGRGSIQFRVYGFMGQGILSRALDLSQAGVEGLFLEELC